MYLEKSKHLIIWIGVVTMVQTSNFHILAFHLQVTILRMKHEPFVGEPSPQRQIMGTHHSNLKSVKITCFCSAKSLVELTCYILENATSLDCLTFGHHLGLFP
jgi:hypothetical protein